ncbi:MAG: translation initiation factor IF-2 [Anaerotruncus sp.]|nr:translation initiation factor IF-2 [Anaerotruncus sp.]
MSRTTEEKIIAVPVSAKSGVGIDGLLDYILLVSEMNELKANPNRTALGTIIEAKVDKGKGPVATVLVQNGTLNRGDVFACGTTYGRVRAMFTDTGSAINEARPSTPVEILGFQETPMAGDRFYVVPDEQIARELIDLRKAKGRDDVPKAPKKMSLDDLFRRMEAGEAKELPVILKCDVQGSVETIDALFNKLSNDKVRILVLHKAVGGISDNDVLLASASKAIVYGFHVRAEKSAQKLAEQEGVEIGIHNIIYELSNEIRLAMEGLLDPEKKEESIGKLMIKQVFKIPKIGLIAGCHVTEGMITRKSFIRVYRDNILIHEGKISSLKRFKNDASEVKQGFECGVGIDNYSDIREGDEIEAYVVKEYAAKM